MAITLTAEFDRLCDVLEEAEKLPRMEAVVMLRRAVEEIEPDTELKTWFIRRAVNLLAPYDDGA